MANGNFRKTRALPVLRGSSARPGVAARLLQRRGARAGAGALRARQRRPADSRASRVARARLSCSSRCALPRRDAASQFSRRRIGRYAAGLPRAPEAMKSLPTSRPRLHCRLQPRHRTAACARALEACASPRRSALTRSGVRFACLGSLNRLAANQAGASGRERLGGPARNAGVRACARRDASHCASGASSKQVL